MGRANTKVILIHGYNKSARDMKFLGRGLKKRGYEPLYARLPLRFKTVEQAEDRFEKFLKKWIKKLRFGERFHLVGHSTGGLIIRRFLDRMPSCHGMVDRVVMIATPNHGISLADWADEKVRFFTQVFKTVQSLKTTTSLAQESQFSFNVEAGAIAGDKNNLVFGRYESGVNDGLVSIDSVYMKGLQDFKILHYGHKEIHHRKRTIILVDHFLKKGRF